ncbi:hypothetical protein A5N17_12300 [Arthrobacter sp. D2]|uniref:hypothetical protein n=1 Tax=Paenarthrobacter ureafaciens TaxID=37931 RepID=UPI0005A4DE8C|nr:hypothetical protein [Paenarthrobacter ureafaciens]ERI36583.2 hypothetical protein M707_15995 [Arthrobacter sp. AK-YN10]NKR16164.1 hypothetical protein [Arthrobacter sp. M6]OEH59474.1 hypothetical protein A5N13_19705 [Arthrobacter sp. D4]OEH62222.1 hypothetical protein A5N17_12300 [Arthrobacter sp. D2]
MRGAAAVVSCLWKHAFKVLLTFALLVGVVSSCSESPSTQALEGPMKDASAAARTTAMAVELRLKGHTTAAAGSTAADDMLKQVDSATKDVQGTSASNGDDQDLRDDVLAAFATISRALIHARDALAAPQGGPEEGRIGSDPSHLMPVLDELHRASDQLDALMTKAGIQ